MKYTFALITLAVTSLTCNAFAQEVSAEQQAQVDLIYAVTCSSQMELITNADVMAAIGSQASLSALRVSTQQFVSSPVTFVNDAIAANEVKVSAYEDAAKVYEDQVTELIASIEKDVPAADIDAAVQKYAADNNMTVEEARPVFLRLNATAYMSQQGIQAPAPAPTRDNVILSSSARSCSVLNIIQAKITASGCKNDAGDVLDMQPSSNFCQAIAAQSAALAAASAQVEAIQSEAQMAVQLLTQTIQKGTEAQLAPVLESMKAPKSELVVIVEGLLSTSNAPVSVTTTP